MPIRSLAAAVLLAGATLATAAGGPAAGTIAIDHPWARATAPGQPAGGAYVRLENRGATPDRLVSARADAARSVELHRMQLEGDVMRMRQVDAIDLPARAAVSLQPGGLHLMLTGLKAPLKAGDRVPVTLRFEHAGEVTVDFAVEAVTPGAAGAQHGASGAPHGTLPHR